MFLVYWNRIANGAMPGQLNEFLYIKWIILSIDLLIGAAAFTTLITMLAVIYIIKFIDIVGLQKTEYSIVQKVHGYDQRFSGNDTSNEST